MQNITISNAERSALRRLVTAHPDWHSYRIARGGLRIDTLSTGPLQSVARDLGIDVAAFIADQRNGSAAFKPAFFRNGVARGGNQSGVPTVRPSNPLGGFAAEPEPVAPPAATSTDLSDVWESIGTLTDGAKRTVANMNAQAKAIETLNTQVQDIARLKPRDININVGGVLVATLSGVRTHPQFETLLKLCSARKSDGCRLNVWISGPAGSGKTTAARQVAAALNLEFSFQGTQVDAHGFVGYVSPIDGTYYGTPFTRAYEHGGVCLLDEVDGCSTEALMPLNAALAGDLLSRPDGVIVKRHADFVCIAAGNTWGEGPSAQYVGRAKLDAATLDRFGAKLFWGYDTALETDTCGNPAWAGMVQRARACASENGMKVLITPRASYDGAALLNAGFTETEVCDLTFLANLNDEQKTTIRRALKGL